MWCPLDAKRMRRLPAAHLISLPVWLLGNHLLLRSPPPAQHCCSRHQNTSITPLSTPMRLEQSSMLCCDISIRSGTAQLWSWSGEQEKVIMQYNSLSQGGACCWGLGNAHCTNLVPGFGPLTGCTGHRAPLC